MFDLQLPWWEFVARAAIVYFVLLAMVRLSGKRTVGQFTPFDLVVVMLLAEAVSDSLRGGDESVSGGLIAAATLVVADMLIAYLSARNRKFDTLMAGSPVLIGRDGAIFKDVLRRNHVPEADVEQALRHADCQLEDMRMAILESDGTINILKRQPEG